MATKYITIDAWKNIGIEPLTIINGEVNSRTLEITVKDGSQVFNLYGASITINMTKPDHTLIFNDCTIVDALNGVFSVAVTSQMAAAVGDILDIEFWLTTPNVSLVKIKNPFKITVSPAVDYSTAVESQNEFTALVNALAELGGIQGQIPEILDGTTPVGDSHKLEGHTVDYFANLDENGKIPSALLPSYVDDVVETYIVGSTPFASGWLSKTFGGSALTPETGIIYIVLTSGDYQNKEYRWSGSLYIEVSSGVQLGETSSTAYRGDRGKIAYDHSQSTGNPHGLTNAVLGSLPASSYTAVDVLAKLLTVDGTGSGLDADKLQGVDGTAFAQIANMFYPNNLYGGIISTNLNTINTSGFYTCYSTATGAPFVDSSAFVLHHNSNAGTVNAWQLARAYTDGRLLYRDKRSSTWTSWSAIPIALVLSGYTSTSDTGAILATDTLNVALNKLRNNSASNIVTTNPTGHPTWTNAQVYLSGIMSLLGATSGIATLDSSGLLTASQKPSYVASEIGAATTNPSWITPTGFSNGWVDFGGTQPVGYYKDILNVVHMRGLIKSGTLTSTAFTLPTGYRPSTICQPLTISNDAVGSVVFYTDGRVVPKTGSSAWFSFDNISFSAF